MPESLAITIESLCKGKSVALVGPSGHLYGKGLGTKIDSFDIVIRFNGLPRPEAWVDYGSRTDVLFLNMGTNYIRSFREELRFSGLDEHQISLIYCPKLKFETRERSHSGPSESVFDNYASLGWQIPFQKMEDIEVHKLSHILGGYPTVGAIGILKVASLGAKNIFICGFSFYEGFNTYYQSVKNKKGGRLRSVAGHPLRKEVRALQNALSGCEYLVSGDPVFNRIIFEKKYRGPNKFLSLSQFIQGVFTGALSKFGEYFNRPN